VSGEADALIRKIAERSGLSEDEVKKRVTEKIKAFAGLLTEVGAAYAVAKELGVDIDIEKEIHKKTPIAQLKPGMERVTVVGRVMRIFPPATYEKNGKKGKYCRIILADNTGEIGLTLWNRDVKYVEEGQIRVGDVIEVINAHVREYGERPSLSMSFDSRIIVNPEGSEKLPEPPKFKKISEIQDGDPMVYAKARVLRIFQPQTVKTNAGESEMVAMIVGDETGTARVVIWDSKKAANVQEGDSIVISAGYAKADERGLTVHIGKLGMIQKTEEPIDVPQTLQSQHNGIKKKRIDQLQEGDRFVAVRGTVSRVFGTKEVLVCKNCGRKIREENGRYICDKCGETEATPRTVLSMELDDGYGRIRAVVFGDLANSMLEELGGPEGLKGEEIVVTGYVRKSNISDRLEFFVKDAARPDYDTEIQDLLALVKQRLGE